MASTFWYPCINPNCALMYTSAHPAPSSCLCGAPFSFSTQQVHYYQPAVQSQPQAAPYHYGNASRQFYPHQVANAGPTQPPMLQVGQPPSQTPPLPYPFLYVTHQSSATMAKIHSQYEIPSNILQSTQSNGQFPLPSFYAPSPFTEAQSAVASNGIQPTPSGHMLHLTSTGDRLPAAQSYTNNNPSARKKRPFRNAIKRSKNQRPLTKRQDIIVPHALIRDVSSVQNSSSNDSIRKNVHNPFVMGCPLNSFPSKELLLKEQAPQEPLSQSSCLCPPLNAPASESIQRTPSIPHETSNVSCLQPQIDNQSNVHRDLTKFSSAATAANAQMQAAQNPFRYSRNAMKNVFRYAKKLRQQNKKVSKTYPKTFLNQERFNFEPQHTLLIYPIMRRSHIWQSGNEAPGPDRLVFDGVSRKIWGVITHPSKDATWFEMLQFYWFGFHSPPLTPVLFPMTTSYSTQIRAASTRSCSHDASARHLQAPYTRNATLKHFLGKFFDPIPFILWSLTHRRYSAFLASEGQVPCFCLASLIMFTVRYWQAPRHLIT